MGAVDLDLFKEKSQTHPDYMDFEEDWQIYRDVMGEGRVDKSTYLPRGLVEVDKQYAIRLRLSQFLPETHLAVEKVVAGLYQHNPTRDLKDTQLSTWCGNVDREGAAWSQYVEDIAAKMLSYGSLRLLVTTPVLRAVDGSVMQSPSRADEISQRAEPYLVLYTPLSVIDWDVDEFARLTFVRIKEEGWARLGSGHVAVTKFIEYDRASLSYWVFHNIDGDQTLVESVEGSPHNLGLVPMVTDCFPRRVRPMIGGGYIRHAARADIQKFQAESDQVYDTHVHAHPVFWAAVKAELAQIGIGSTSFIKLDPDSNEKVGYAQSPVGASEMLKMLIDEKRAVIYRQAGTDPLGVLSTKSTSFQTSGVSRAWSFGTSEARLLRRVASRMEVVERRVFELLSRYYSAKESTSIDETLFKGSITYPEEFDLSATDTLIDETDRIGELINSEKLQRKLQHRIAAAKVGDAPEEDLREIHDEIENNPLFGQFGNKKPVSPTAMPQLPRTSDVNLSGGTGGDVNEGGAVRTDRS